jgi:hypothetical protein
MVARINERYSRNTQIMRYKWRLLPRERELPVCLSYAVEGDRILVPGKPGGVRFAFPIGNVAETEEAIVICLKIPPGRKCSDNVYAIDRDGNLLWRVRSRRLGANAGQFVGVTLAGAAVRLHGEDGNWFDIDPKRGTPL